MGGVVSAIGDAVGGVVDAVGSVAEAAVDVVSDVVEVVADNPLLLAAAVASPYALSAMSSSAVAGVGTTAAAGAGVSASSMGLVGPTLMGAAGATPAALASYAAATGAGAGVLGGGALAGGLTLLPASTYLGSVATSAGGLMADSFAFPSITQATNFGTSILDATGSNLAMFNPTQTAASTVMGNSPTVAFDSNYLSSNMFTQAKQAASLVDSPGMSFSNAISQATNGSIVPTNSTNFFSTAWDSAKGLYQTAEKLGSQFDDFVNTIGKTIAPNADPLVQRSITNFGTNMVTTGGDVEQSLKGSLIGPATGVIGKEVTTLTSPAMGDFGSRLLGGTAANTAGALLSGATPEQALMGASIGATGSTVTNLTGSPLLGGAAKTIAGSALTGRDVSDSLLGYGASAGVDALSDYLVEKSGLPTSGIIGRLTRPVIGSLEDQLRQTIIPSRPANIAQVARPSTNISPLSKTSLTQVLQSKPSSVTNQPSTGVLPAANVPAQKVDVSKLKPVDISTLGLKVQ